MMPSQPAALATGDNYEFYQYGAIVACRVIKRPDLSSQRGAECAKEIAEHLERYSQGTRPPPVLFDMREAPTVMGPISEGHLMKLFAGFERRGQRLAVCCSTEVMQRMQYQRLVAMHAPGVGSVHPNREDAIAALEQPASGTARKR